MRAPRPAIGANPRINLLILVPVHKFVVIQDRITTDLYTGTKFVKRKARRSGPFISRECGALPASTATAAATAAAGAEATTATARTTTATGTATAGSAGTILRFIDAQLTTAQRETVQGLDGLRGLGLRHFNEAKAARTTGFTVGRQRNRLDRAMCGEQVANLCFSRRERQVSNVDLHDSKLSLFINNGPRSAINPMDGSGHYYTAGNTVGIVWRAWAWLGRTFEQLLSPDR